jgi:para-aminobenzoate synthetase component I
LRATGPGARAVGFLGYELAPVLDPLLRIPAGVRRLPDAWWAVLPARLGGWAVAPERPFRAAGEPSVSLTDEAFRAGVEAVRASIGAGDVYQVNLTRRWRTPCAGDSLALFERLRRPHPPAFATFLEDRAQGWAVLCLSPELLVRRRGARLETRPIKGTRPRGATAGDDARASAELAASRKDAAELAMIVDLERNDLNRVCRPGSVRVRAAGRPLATADVVHREAVVVGELEPGLSWDAILRALFPGGSVTGAPKLAACAAIAALEPVPRSVYCGALGVIRASGDGTLAMPIRTGTVAAGELSFHAGCGIVHDSEAGAEERESRAKVASWFAALEE